MRKPDLRFFYVLICTDTEENMIVFRRSSMRLNKQQVIVISLLNVLIVALVAAILFVPKSFWPGGKTDKPVGGDQTDGPEPPAHNKLRDAVKGRIPEIERETRLMGVGDETAVKVFFEDDGVYIYGNATVKGLDFDDYGGFLCIVDGNGKITSYKYFDGAITAVGVLPGGHAVAAGKTLYSVKNGEPTVIAELNGSALGLYATDRGVAAVTQPTTSSLMYAEYIAADEGEWTPDKATRIDSGYTLRFFDCYDFGGSRVIAARAHSLPMYDSVVFYKFEPGGDASAHYYGGTGENVTRPYAVMPYPGGYFAVAAKNGIATFINVDYTFATYRSQSLGYTFTDATLLYSGGYYYTCFDRQDGSVTYELDENLSRRRLTALDGVKTQCALDTSPLAVVGRVSERSGTGSGGVAVNVVTPSTGAAVSLPITEGTVYAGAVIGGKTTLVLSASGGDALSVGSGGLDIYVVTLA